MPVKQIGCALGLLLALIIIGAVTFRPPGLPSQAAQAVDTYVRATGGISGNYSIVSTEKGARTIGGNAENIEFIPGGVHWPVGIIAPNSPRAAENWCVIVDHPAGTTHLLVQKQESAWVIQGVSDAQRVLFSHFGCGRW